MQKQIRNIVIGIATALGTSLAVADSAPQAAPTVAAAAQHAHATGTSIRSADGLSTAEWRYVGGEPGWIHEVGNPGARAGKTRAEVQKELVEFQRNPGAQVRHLSLYIRG